MGDLGIILSENVKKWVKVVESGAKLLMFVIKE
jgi:hypothetical protein